MGFAERRAWLPRPGTFADSAPAAPAKNQAAIAGGLSLKLSGERGELYIELYIVGGFAFELCVC